MTDDFTSLAERTALVTGASGGLGAHFAAVLARAGARVALGARRTVELEAVAAAIDGVTMTVPLDVTDDASVQAALDRIDGAWGPVDLLINNAGIVERGRDPLNMAVQRFADVVEVNLTSVFRLSREVARRLIAAGRPGAIVNIASLLSFEISPGVPAYCASKAGVAHLTRQMAVELAPHGIRVNALAPGYFKTDLNRAFLESDMGRRLAARIPQQRLGRVDDLDAPLLLLAGPGGAYMTGVVLSVDGGHRVAGV